MREINFRKDLVLYTALVDDEDYDFLKSHTWYYTNGYASTSINRSAVYMSQLILGIKEGYEIDHKDRNKLNYQRNNLRHVTKLQNQGNRPINKNNKSGYKGVFFAERNTLRPWQATITINGRSKYLGAFFNKQEAALAYNKAAIKHFGEFAVINEVGTTGSE